MKTLALFLVALGFRWVELQWMSFKFDQMAVVERALMIAGGQAPFFGIVNSLGFRNAPGYIWTLMPAVLFSSSPVVAAAWHGLIAATIVFPMALLGRLLSSGGIFSWFPAVACAVLPWSVFAGRELWAQHLLAPLGAWALWALICALLPEKAARSRLRYGALALALLCWMTSIHYGAGPLLLIAGVALWPVFRRVPWKASALALLPSALILVTMLPSVADYFYRQKHPLPKPDYVLQFERVRPAPRPLYQRLPRTAAAALNGNSLNTVGGVDLVAARALVLAASLLDACVLSLLLFGLFFCAVTASLGQRQELEKSSKIPPAIPLLLLAWIVFPAVLGAVLFKYPQESYFAASRPASFLALVVGSRRFSGPGVAWPRTCDRVITILTGAGAAVMSVLLIRETIDPPHVLAEYHVPYAQQKRVADYLRRQGVAPGRIVHFSGDLLVPAYNFLVKHSQAGGSTLSGSPWNSLPRPTAYLQNFDLLESRPKEAAFMSRHSAVRIGPVVVGIRQ